MSTACWCAHAAQVRTRAGVCALAGEGQKSIFLMLCSDATLHIPDDVRFSRSSSLDRVSRRDFLVTIDGQTTYVRVPMSGNSRNPSVLDTYIIIEWQILGQEILKIQFFFALITQSFKVAQRVHLGVVKVWMYSARGVWATVQRCFHCRGILGRLPPGKLWFWEGPKGEFQAMTLKTVTSTEVEKSIISYDMIKVYWKWTAIAVRLYWFLRIVRNHSSKYMPETTELHILCSQKYILLNGV